MMLHFDKNAIFFFIFIDITCTNEINVVSLRAFWNYMSNFAIKTNIKSQHLKF